MLKVAVPLDYVRHFELPAVCVRTGVPTTRSYPKMTYRSRIWMLVFQWSWVFGLVLRAFSDGVMVRVPLRSSLRWRRLVCGWLAILAFFPALVLGVGVLLDPTPSLAAVALLAVGSFAGLVRAYATAGVPFRRQGDVVHLHAHPAFADALRAEMAEPVVWPMVSAV